MEEKVKEKKGVALKVFGVSLFIVGSLNAVLFWRGGMPLDVFNPSVMALGITFFIIGTLRGIE
ncbi:MAG: hypothetical protein IME96_04350 [Proteobacteria bacterium]|nr:hypothetical protein [Pseudomonadota bacterium]